MTRRGGSEPLLEPIAVVGMACRFPGAPDVRRYWRNLRDGVESIRFFTADELSAAGVPSEAAADPAYVPAAGYLEDADCFDAELFEVNPRVAEITDPQHRVFLECAWAALEDAGYGATEGRGSVGVYAGVSLNGYLLEHYGAHREAFGAMGELQAAIGNRTDHLTTMVAYKLGLDGPAVTVQTTCSTSLVAVHLASQALLGYQCRMALAGGSRIVVPQTAGYHYRPGDILSPDGHCRPFDRDAGGTVSGSGAGVVVLKRLSDALEDGDTVRAVLRGSAVNNDGASKVGYTAPALDGQAKAVALALAVSGVDPDAVSYLETHGTATPMGDPIEVAALDRVFRKRTRRKGFCTLGAVKSNIGHLDTAAGVAGLIKTVLALEHRQIPPTLHFRSPNPDLRLGDGPFRVSPSLADWPAGPEPRRAGVSSFGIGGTNAHVVLEEAPETEPSGPSRPWQVLTLSARSAPALERSTEALGARLRESPGFNDRGLADAAYTLHVGRTAFEHRRAVVCTGPEDALELFREPDPKRVFSSLGEPRERPVIFLFPGQGTQRPGMGAELYRTEPQVRYWLDRAADGLRAGCGLDLLARIHGSGADDEGVASTEVAQPALFALEHALARLWMSWGIRPAAMLGHSLGEYVAATLAGVFEFEDALDLVAFRGRAMQELPPGAMSAVRLGEDALRERLAQLGIPEEEVSLAALNRPAVSVVSGLPHAVERLERELAAHGVVTTRLRTSHAFHSAMMEPIVERFGERVASVPRKPPSIPYVSNLTGRWIAPDQATDPGYWVRHLRRTVRFDEGLTTLLRQGEGVLLEVGPGTVLSTLVRQHPARSADHVVVPSVPEANGGGAEGEGLGAAVARLWVAGSPVDWEAFHAGERRRRIPLPAYPFERRRFWIAGEGRSAETEPGRRPPHRWLWAPSWRRSAAGTLRRRASLEPGGGWLLVMDDEGLGEALGRRLDAMGQTVVALDPRRPEGFEDRVRELVGRAGAAPIRVVYLGAVTGAQAPTPSSLVDLSFHAPLHLVQALSRARAGDSAEAPLEVTLVSDGMQEVTGGDLRWPEKATLLGPCRVAPKEYPAFRLRSVDLELPPPGPGRAALVELLVRELAGEASEPVVAFRGGYRWVQDFEPLHLGSASAEGGAGAAGSLRRGGVYLVTGGFGGMGLALAEHLVREAGARIALLGRTALPEPASWDDRLAEPTTPAAVRRRIEAVRRLEALGGEVLPVAADVADRAQVARALDEVRAGLGAVRGVIHAAGVPPEGVIELKTPERAEAVLAPKVAGTRVLAELLADEDLDLFVLCSSRSSVLGPAGAVDYAAANAFQDAFAHRLRAEGGTGVVAVDWCAWKDVGMLAEAHARTAGVEGPAGPGEPAGHPLLDRRWSEATREVLQGALGPRTHWLLQDHRIGGHAVVPGTTYLELARAAAAARGLRGPYALRDVFFLTPVRVRDDESRDVRLVLEERAEGGFRFTAASPSPGGARWEDAAVGVIEPVAANESPETRSLDEILARCRDRLSVALVEDELREDLGPHWQTVHRVHHGDGEVLGLLELDGAFSREVETLALHPALLDRAVSLGVNYLADDLEGAFHLPMSYRTVVVHGSLPPRIWSHVRRLDPPGAAKETVSFAVTLFDDHGRVLVDIDHFSRKRVGDAWGRLRSLVAPGEGPPADTAMARARDAGLTAAEGVATFARILAETDSAQVVVSPDDLREAMARAAAFRPEDVAGEAAPDRPTHARPEVESPFVEPRSDLEGRLACLWAGVLGLDRVGVHDNYFELGGDSLLGIQVIARAREEGLEVAPSELFEHQTVAELAAALEGRAAVPPQDPPLARAPRDRELRLSFAQERLWFLDQLEPGSAAYNIAAPVRLQGRLDLGAVARSLGRIVGRQEALRTRFAATDGEPVQEVLDRLPLVPRVIDLSGRPEALDEAVRRTVEQPFDLARPPLARACLFRLATDDHLALFVLHHAVADGWSIGLFVRELGAFYRAETGGDPAELPELPVQYADYAAWQRERFEAGRFASDLAYWSDRLAGAPESLPLPTDRPRSSARSSRGRTRLWHVAAGRVDGLGELARRHESTLFMAVLSAFAALLLRHVGEDDLVVGTPVANRERPEVHDVVGLFVNTLALRLDLAPGPEGRPGFREVLARVRAATLAAYAHQELPFEKLVEALGVERSLDRAPLFQVMFGFQNAPVERLALPGLVLEPRVADSRTAMFDLMMMVHGTDDGLSGTLSYRSELFDPTTVERFLGQFEALLAAAVAEPDRPVMDLPLLAPGALHQVVREWNDTATPRPAGGLLHGLFAAQAERTPDAVAVVSGGRVLSYAALARRAGALARRLAAAGFGPGDRVGLHVGRSPEMAVAVLGVLEAGCACVPLDPANPAERLGLMAGDAGVALFLADRSPPEPLAGAAPDLWRLDPDGPAAPDADAATPLRPDSDDLVYVIYTSGSTGRPKGVAMAHGPLVNLVRWQCSERRLRNGVRRLQFASLGFDGSFREMFATWGSGGTLELIREELRTDVGALVDFVAEHRVETLLLPAVMLELVAEEGCRRPGALASLREVLSAGEQVRVTRTVAELFEALGDCAFHNHYGPTETHVAVAQPLGPRPGSRGPLPPIGRPIANAGVGIVDPAGRTVPPGVPGELLVGGPLLARGYLGRPALTAERFVPDPDRPAPGGRRYRTGDLARHLADGTLEFLGRIDLQVKVRGYRVEPGEVETVLAGHPSVRQAAVVARSPGLVAYVVPEGEARSRDELRAHLARRLPEAMVPSTFVFLDRLPLSPNRKVDRRALPDPDPAPGAAGAGGQPATAAEELVAQIWCELLDLEEVGLQDDFFRLGGHSLLATRVAARLRRVFRLESWPLRTLFEEPTVAGTVRSLARAWGDRETLEEVAELYRRVEALSRDEVAELAAE